MKKGFTLIELLVVIGIIGILAAIVLVAVNPARQFGLSRDTTRRNDLYQTLNAVYQYSVDNNGNFPASITATPTDIGSSGLDLAVVLAPTYIPQIPFDPTCTANCGATTGYVLFQETNGRLTASATGEINDPITITR